MGPEDVIEGLNIYRAVEACGERVMRMWAESDSEPEARKGFATIAVREGNHARALSERILALGGQPGPTCVDHALSVFIEQASGVSETKARLELFNAMVNGKGETAEALAACMQGIRTAFAEGDAETRHMLEGIFVDEKLSIDWCAAYKPAPAHPAKERATA